VKAPWHRRLATGISALSLGTVFVLFIYGVGMRYLFNRPIGWVDEVVTVLTVWSVLWTAAFVLPWRDYIAFDVVFVSIAPQRQRWMLLLANIAFAALFISALPDMLEMRLDFVYAIYPMFFVVIVLRQLVSVWCLLRPGWRDELPHWGGSADEARP
jgi:TRAP-type C4-dicarboxylate transport system permease small subunit